MIFFLICYLLFAQAWGETDTAPQPHITYEPRRLDHYTGCAADFVTTTTTEVNTDKWDGSTYTTTETSSYMTWVPVATGQKLPPSTCGTHGSKNSWSLIAMLIAPWEDDNPHLAPKHVSHLIPCGGEDSTYQEDPIIIVAADKDCIAMAFWKSPPDSVFPDADPGDWKTTKYEGILWGLADASLPFLYTIWRIAFSHPNRLQWYHPEMTGTYGDGVYKMYDNHCICDNWDDRDRRRRNWVCGCAFPWSGIRKNQNTDDISLPAHRRSLGLNSASGNVSTSEMESPG